MLAKRAHTESIIIQGYLNSTGCLYGVETEQETGAQHHHGKEGVKDLHCKHPGFSKMDVEVISNLD